MAGEKQRFTLASCRASEASPVNVRTIKGGPFCWQGKDTLRLLADACDGRTDRAMVLAVYLSLSWFASDKGAEEFTETKGRIAERAGVSYRKAADVLSFLGRIGLVGIKENAISGTKERGPNTYTLGTLCSTSGTSCLRLGTDAKQGSVPRLIEERLEELPEELPEQRSPARAGSVSRFVVPSADEVATYSKEIGYPMDGAAWCDSYAQKGWMIGKGRMKDWRAAVRNWKRNGWQPTAIKTLNGSARSYAPL